MRHGKFLLAFFFILLQTPEEYNRFLYGKRAAGGRP
jgi:hypothetical protein